MVNVAPVTGPAQLDPSLLTGWAEQGQAGRWSWEPPEAPEERVDDGSWSLPPWLTQPPGPKPPDTIVPIEPVTDVDGRMKSSKAFMQKFKACPNLEALKELALQVGIELRAYSRLAFRQLLATKQPTGVLLNFLEDPTLNDAKARNLWFLLKSYFARPTRAEDSRSFVTQVAPWFKTQLSLGKLSQSEIAELLNFLSVVAKNSKDASMTYNLAEHIVEGIEACRVIGDSPIKWTILAKILKSLTEASCIQQTRLLGYKLVGKVPHSHLHEFEESLSAIFAGIFRDNDSGDIGLNAELTQAAASISTGRVKRSIIVRTSKAMIEDLYCKSIPDLERSQLLEIWCSGMANRSPEMFLRGNGLSRMMSFQSCDILAPQLAHLDDFAVTRFVLQYWMRAPGHGTNVRMLTSQQRNFNDLFSYISRLAQDSSEAMPSLLTRLFEILKSMSRSATIVDIVLNAPKHGIEIPLTVVLDQIRSHLKDFPVYARKLFRSDPRLCLERCPEIAEHVIQNDNIHPDAVWYYLKQGSRLRRRHAYIPALKQGWRHDRAELYERMAVAFTKSPHLSSRMAFRHVHRCYSNHKKEELGSVGKALSQSLITAGVILPLQRRQWVSSVKLRWILSIVRAGEGDEVADNIDHLVYAWRGEVLKHLKMGTRYDAMFKTLDDDARWSRRKRKCVTPLPLPSPHFRCFPGRGKTR